LARWAAHGHAQGRVPPLTAGRTPWSIVPAWINREIAEELYLAEQTDFTVSDEPVAHLEYTAWSVGAGEETQYTVELFEVQLLGDSTARIEADSANRWICEDEVRAQCCRDGRPVSEQEMQLAKDWFQDVARSGTGWLHISGESGTGKTWFAGELRRRLSANPWEGFFGVKQSITATALRQLGLT
jgi:hypothetical protein